MNGLKQYIETMFSLSADEWEQIAACTEKITLDKSNILIHKDAGFKKEIFVQEGIMRAYFMDADGNEKTTGFFRKNEFVTMFATRTKNGRSLYTYQALNPSTLILINRERFSALLSQIHKLKQLVKEVKEKETYRLSNRDECLLQVRAKEKYSKFREFYPGIESEIPHYYIASYLGLTPVSLSRIRKKLGILDHH
jgi:CRP-like cAMP-binding protein